MLYLNLKSLFLTEKKQTLLQQFQADKLERLAKEAKAIYKVDKIVLVNCDILEAYFECFHLAE